MPESPTPGPPYGPRQALVRARRLVRSLAAAPDPERRAREVLFELRHEAGWSARAQDAIAATEAWLSHRPSADAIAPRLRALLATLA